jgi:hypothetical protein
LEPPIKEEILLVDKLCSGDRPSIYVAGMLVAHALQKGKFAVFTQNVLGEVVMLPSSIVKVSHPVALLVDEALDKYAEDEALTLMIKEGRHEDDILAYIERRRSREESKAQ